MHHDLHVFSLSDMGGVIPEDEEEYDDCLTMNQPTNHSEPIDDDIYEELPGLLLNFLFFGVFALYCYLFTSDVDNQL